MTQSPGRRGPYAKTADRRAAIARAAYEVVMEVGHVELTTAAVAERAGIRENTMLYHFPTRDHLLVAAIEHFEESVVPVLPGQDITDDMLRQTIEVLAARAAAEDKRLRLQVFLAASAQDPNHPAHDYYRRHNAHSIKQMAVLMRLRQERGLARPDRDPVRMARRFLAAWDGLQQQWLISGDFDLAEAIAEAFRDISGQSVVEAKQAVEALLSRI